MKGEEIYENLLRIDKLKKIEEEGKRKLTKEEQIEYDSLTRKKLYTLDELRSYHNTIRSFGSEQLTTIIGNIKRDEPWEINEDLPEGLIEKFSDLEEMIDEKIDASATVGNIAKDDTTRIELVGCLKEGILSGIRQKYGESVENELYSLINDELNRSLINSIKII